MVNQGEVRESRVGTDEAEGEEATGMEAFNPKEVLGMVEGFARENPHAAVLSACAIGFLLGGGLTPRLLGQVAVIAGRQYLNQSMRATLEGVLREQLHAR